MDKIETYAEEKFILNLFLNVPNHMPPNEEHKIWEKVYDIIVSKSILHIDSIEELSLLAGINPITGKFTQDCQNILAKILLKSPYSGGSELKVNKKHFDEIHSDKLNFLKTETPSPIYCLSSPIENINCGIFVTDSRNYLNDFKEIAGDSKPSSINKKKQRSFNWGDQFLYKPPLNSIIIIDPFLYDNKGTLKKNLFPILELLLPKKKLDETIHITLIAKKTQKYSKEKIAEFLKEVKGYIQTKISDFKLGMYITPGSMDLHSRMIITNYFYLKSDRGFFIITPSNTFKDNDFEFHPLCTNLSFINEERKKLAGYVSKCHNNIEGEPRQFGDKANRLLDITE